VTEASYTAWDDKQYVWPPPEGWYQAADQKWWPEGYGPPPEAAEAPAEVADAADSIDDAAGTDTAAGTDIAAGTAAAAGAATMAFGDEVSNGAAGVVSEGSDRLSALLPDAATSASETTIMSPDGIGDAAGGLADRASGVSDLLPDSVGDLSVPDVSVPDVSVPEVSVPDVDVSVPDVDVSVPDVSVPDVSVPDVDVAVPDIDGVPTADISSIDAKLDGLNKQVSDLGDLSAPDLGDLPAPGAASLGGASGLSDLGESAADLGDDIPSIKDLASPDMDLSDIPSPSGIADDVTQALPTDLPDSLSDQLPPPPNLQAPDGVDSSLFDAPTIGAPTAGASSLDAPGFDASPPQGLGDVAMAPPTGGPGPGPGPGLGSPPQYSAPGFGNQPDGPNGALQQEILSSKESGGRSKTLLFVILGVLALAAIGAALYWQFGRNADSSDDVAAAATGPGSVNEPHPRSTGVVVFYPDGDTDQRWVIQVTEPVAAGTGDLASGDADGNVYAVARVQVRNESGSEGALLSDLHFNAVNAAGELIDRQANPCPATAEDLDYGAAVGVGEEVVGSVCWIVPAGDLEGLKLGLESDKVAGRVHILLQ
jgi:hypothetical protein